MSKAERNFSRRYKKEYHIFRSIFYMCFLWIVVNFVNYFMYNLKVIGRENIPKKGHIIFAANHVSEMDPPFLATAVNKHVAFMAKKELFGNDKRSWLIKRLGAFAVDREKPEMATFKTVRDIFETNWPLGIFPQGGTKKNNKIEDIRKGFVVIAKHAKANIVPVSICVFAYFCTPLLNYFISIQFIRNWFTNYYFYIFFK